jgi:hypothetical protein
MRHKKRRSSKEKATVLDKTEQQEPKCERCDFHLGEIISPDNDFKKSQSIKLGINFLTESLILAQDERWRRA